MNIIEKYEYYKKGLVMRNTSVTQQNFFKTNPTPEQMLLLSRMQHDDQIISSAGLLIYFILGIVVGLGLSLAMYLESLA